ncbi:solute carrier family 23 protein [Clostridium sp. AM54-14XD]|uniref:solute carrier family 23 protein n=1 Tax=Clostridium sp. AM54-14XD TaxID=2293037 RepID=UPI0024E21D69|nr:solute carrier family 23 protein [Clostridium sp. AM54-14XD]
MLIVAFCLVDMFDTIGTLYGTASQANMLDENGDPINLDKSMMCDSIGTAAGAILGTSTCTTSLSLHPVSQQVVEQVLQV